MNIMAEHMGGPSSTSGRAIAHEIRATLFHCFQLLLQMLTMAPNSARLEHHTQSDPPRVPVTLYHWMSLMVVAKALPSTSQGHDIWALVRYHLSHAIQVTARKI